MAKYCDVRGCPERYRCLDVDCPTRCPVYRMHHSSNLKISKSSKGELWLKKAK